MSEQRITCYVCKRKFSHTTGQRLVCRDCERGEIGPVVIGTREDVESMKASGAVPANATSIMDYEEESEK